MLELTKQYIIPATIIAIIIIALVLLVYNNRKDVLYKAALVAVTKAQATWGSNMGKVKFAEAYAYLKSQYPLITFFISPDDLSAIIEQALEEMKQLIIAKDAKEKKDTDYIRDDLTQSVLKQVQVDDK